MYTLKITIEHHDKIKVSRVRCHTPEALAQERAHQRAMAPTGSTVTFTEAR